MGVIKAPQTGSEIDILDVTLLPEVEYKNMWKQDLIDRIWSVHDGKQGNDTEQLLVREYMVFYGERDGQCYCMGYDTVMDMYAGRKPNNLRWIEYDQTHEIIYSQSMGRE